MSTDNNISNSYFQVPNVPIGSNWTLAWWSKFPLATFNNSWRTMFRSYTNDHQVLVDSSGNLGVYDNQGGTGFHACGYNINSLSGWHQMTAVGTGGTTTFYLDGTQICSSNYQSTNSIYAIGNYQGGSQNWGQFDDVRIYSRALSVAEIKALVNQGASTQAEGGDF